MVCFTAVIKKFGSNGDKTSWRYIEITSEQVHLIKPDTRVSFPVKGMLDNIPVEGFSLLPAGGGNFIMPLKADLRKKLRKNEGATLQVQLQADEKAYQVNKDFLDCLKDSPDAASNFNKLSRSHQNYFSKWIESAKTEATRTKRIAQSVEALRLNLSYSEMIRKNQGKSLI